MRQAERSRARAVRVVVVAALLVASIGRTPSVSATHNVACQDNNFVNRFAGEEVSYSGADGVRATLQSEDLALCTTVADDDRGSFTWVAVGHSSGGNNIAQIGLMKCEDPTNPSACDTALRYFYAWGRSSSTPGCEGIPNRLPTPINKGVAGSTNQIFMVVRTSGEWRFFRGDVVQQSIVETALCWPKNRVWWLGESWDGGDAIGGHSLDKYTFSGARYQQVQNGSWLNPTFSDPCAYGDVIRICDVIASDALNLWTDH